MYLRWSIDQSYQNLYQEVIGDLMKCNRDLKELATKLRNEDQESDKKFI